MTTRPTDRQPDPTDVDLDSILTGYLAAALWSSTVGDESTPMDDNYSADDVSEETVRHAAHDIKRFTTMCAARGIDLDTVAETQTHGLEHIGHDLWLTRNGHGCGFWDGDYPEHGDTLTAICKELGEVNLYVGNDGKVWSYAALTSEPRCPVCGGTFGATFDVLLGDAAVRWDGREFVGADQTDIGWDSAESAETTDGDVVYICEADPEHLIAVPFDDNGLPGEPYRVSVKVTATVTRWAELPPEQTLRWGDWLARMVRTGQRYGREDCLTHDGPEAMIEFYDATQDLAKFGPRGQFVSRYYASTFADAVADGRGLNLHGGVPAWCLTPSDVRTVAAWMVSL